MWQQDGAPAYIINTSCGIVNKEFEGKAIGKRGYVHRLLKMHLILRKIDVYDLCMSMDNEQDTDNLRMKKKKGQVIFLRKPYIFQLLI